MPKPAYGRPMPHRLPFYRVLAAKVGETYRLVSLAQRPTTIETHWVDSHTQPHCLPESECEGCRQKKTLRWKCYLPCLVCGTTTVVIAEITQQAVLHCAHLREPGRLIRGWAFSLRRKGVRRNSPVEVWPCDVRVDPRTLPPDFDVRPHLERMWGFVPDVTPQLLSANTKEGGVA